MVFDLAHHRKRCGLRSGVCSPFHAGHGHAQERTNWKCQRALQSASKYWREHRNIRCQHLGDPSFTNTPLGLVPLFDTQPRAPAWSLHTSGTGTLSRRPSSRPTSSIRQVSERVRHTGYCLFLRRRIAVYRNRLFALCAYHFRGSQRQGEERRSRGCALARNHRWQKNNNTWKFVMKFSASVTNSNVCATNKKNCAATTSLLITEIPITRTKTTHRRIRKRTVMKTRMETRAATKIRTTNRRKNRNRL